MNLTYPGTCTLHCNVYKLYMLFLMIGVFCDGACCESITLKLLNGRRQIVIVIIILPEKYFRLSRKQCKEGFDMYKKFVVRMDACAKIFKLAEVMNDRVSCTPTPSLVNTSVCAFSSFELPLPISQSLASLSNLFLSVAAVLRYKIPTLQFFSVEKLIF